MNGSLYKEIEAWEGEGGAALGLPGADTTSTGGTASQMECAQRIKRLANEECDVVAAPVRSIADRQTDHQRTNAEKTVAILAARQQKF